jgi:hypothetical protein
MAQQTKTGIAGNNTTAVSQASAARTTAVNASNVFHATVALLLIVIGVTLADQGLGFFWKLVVGWVFIFIGGKLATVEGYDTYRGAWPQIFRGLGWVVIGTTLLLSGIGQWTGSVTEGVDTVAFCAVSKNKETPRCVAAKAEKEKAEEKPVVQYQAPVAEPQVAATQRLPTDIRVLCQDESRGCFKVPRSPEVQAAQVDRKSDGLCIGYHAEPARDITYEMKNGEVTFMVPPDTDFWWFYLRQGEQFRDRPRCE